MGKANPRRANGHQRDKVRARVLREEADCWLCGKPVDKTLPPHLAGSPEVDEVIPVKPSHCEGCSAPIDGEDPAPERHQVFEVPKIEPKVTEYQIHTLSCDCGTRTKARLPEGVPRGAFGCNLVALVCWLTGRFRLSKRAVQELLSDLLRTKVSLGAVSKMEREASAAVAAPR